MTPIIIFAMYYRMASKKIQIFTETAFNEEFPAGAEVTSCFYDYPKTFVKDQQTDYTVNGGVISMIDEVNKIYKALLTIPQSGGESSVFV